MCKHMSELLKIMFKQIFSVYAPILFKSTTITLQQFESNFVDQGYCQLWISRLSIVIQMLHTSSQCVPMTFSAANPASYFVLFHVSF